METKDAIPRIRQAGYLHHHPAPDGITKVAWSNDLDSNVLSLTQG